MATWTNDNNTYYINPAYLTFVENSGYGANLIQVSASSSCYISVYDPANGIGYSDADKNYRRWKITAYNNKFPDNSEMWSFNIYVRLNRSGADSLIVYDPLLRGVNGGQITEETDESGDKVLVEGEPDPNYYYIRLGVASEVKAHGLREITYDTGYLNTDRGLSDKDGLSAMWELIKFNTPWLIRAKQWLQSFTVKGFITLIGGLIFKNDKGVEKIVKDIKRSTDNAPEYVVDENGAFVKDEEGNYIPNPDYVPISDETIPTTKWAVQLSDDRYIRKDQPDETEYKVKFFDGVECGKFVEGPLAVLGGSGTRFDGEGYGEMNGLRLREFLEVPELRFNRVDVVSGILWNSIAFGVIDGAKVNAGGDGGTCTLKLEDGERSGLHLNDICMGIFSDFGNGTVEDVIDPDTGEVLDPGEDENGLPKMYGFSTSYFTPSKVLQNGAGVFEFEYTLQPGTSVHPCQSMKFAVYGNFIDTTRQASAYSTRTYKRYMNKVSTWRINPDEHIYAQYGLLDGLTIGGKEMKGYGSYQQNTYITGSVFEFTPQQKEELKGDDAYSAVLSDYVGTIRIDERGELIGEQYVDHNVTTGDENVVTGDENVVTSGYLLRTRVQAYRGKTELSYSDSAGEGVYIAGISPVGCEATMENGNVFVSEITDLEYCYVKITVSCEGNASFELTYQIKLAKDGIASFVSMVFTRFNATEGKAAPDTPKGGSYYSPMPDPNPTEDDITWHDGIPDGEHQLWSSSRTFTSDGAYPQGDWSTPKPMTDTADLEQIFHDEIKDSGAEPEPPTNLPDSAGTWEPDNGWVDDPTPSAVWMATNIKRNGEWGTWKITRIKGEKGDNALSLVPSVNTIIRNSFGSYEPSSVQVKAMLDGVEEPANITVYGVKQDHTVAVVSKCENRSSVELNVAGYAAENYLRLVFRAYIGIVDDYDDKSYFAQASIAFIGDGSSGPMPRNCGEHSVSGMYYYNNEYRDFVWATTSSGVQVFMRDGLGYVDTEDESTANNAVDGSVPGTVALQPPFWIEVPKTVMTAIDTALIDTANIAGFMFRNGKMVSQETGSDPMKEQSNLILDGKNGVITARKGVFKGDLYGKTISFEPLETDDNDRILPEIQGRYGMFYMDNAISLSRSVVQQTYKASGEDRIVSITGASSASSSTSISITNQETLMLFSMSDTEGDYWSAVKLPYWIFGREFNDSVANIQKITKEEEATDSDVLYIITG